MRFFLICLKDTLKKIDKIVLESHDTELKENVLGKIKKLLEKNQFRIMVSQLEDGDSMVYAKSDFFTKF